MATCTGTVTSFNFGKDGQAGYGFITSSSVQGDVYFQRKHLPEDLKNFGFNDVIKGLTVTFQLTQTPEGRPQGINIQLDPQQGEPVIGKIRSYSQKHRYGFITSAHTSEDCYFQQKELPPSMQLVEGSRLVGQTVQFEILTKPDGASWATKLKLHKMIMAAGNNPAAQANALAMQLPGMFPQPPQGVIKPSMGKRPLGSFAGQTPGPKAKQPRMVQQEAGDQKTGTVLSFNEAKGFGFISAGIAGDVFFHKDDLAPGTPHELAGSQVKFLLTINNGKPRAKMVTCA